MGNELSTPYFLQTARLFFGKEHTITHIRSVCMYVKVCALDAAAATRSAVIFWGIPQLLRVPPRDRETDMIGVRTRVPEPDVRIGRRCTLWTQVPHFVFFLWP